MMSLNGPLNFLVNLAFIALIVILSSSCGQRQSSGDELGLSSGSVIVGDIDWRDIEDVSDELVQQNARAVAYIDLPSMESRCTGFMISDNLLMTNQHCIPTESDARGITAYFNYDRRTGKSGAQSVRCDEFVLNDERLDFAIVRCQGSPGQRFGKLKVATSTVSAGQGIYVLHQNCDYYTSKTCDWFKKYSQATVSEVTDEIGHSADTLGGSSGSPLFSAKTHQLVGLHHVGIGNNGFGRGRMNYAVKMSDIAEFLASNHQNLWQELSGGTSSGGRTPARTEEPNNSLTSAFAFSVGQTQAFSIGSGDDVDFFSFSVPSRKTVLVELNFQHRLGDLELKLYRSNGVLVASSLGSSDLERITRVLSAGNYVVKVYGYKQARGDYRLSVR